MEKTIKTLIIVGYFVQLDGVSQRNLKVDEPGFIVREPIINQLAKHPVGDGDLMSKSDLQAFLEQQQNKLNFDGDQRELIGSQNSAQYNAQRNGDLEYPQMKSDNEGDDKREKFSLFSEYQQFFMRILAFFIKK